MAWTKSRKSIFLAKSGIDLKNISILLTKNYKQTSTCISPEFCCCGNFHKKVALFIGCAKYRLVCAVIK